MIGEIKLPNAHNNRVVLSRLFEYDDTEKNANFYGIKYVVKGTESYYLNNKNYDVSEGQFLLSDLGKTYATQVKSREEVWGVCIFLDPHFMHDVYRNISKNDDYLLDDPLESVSLSLITEKKYACTQNAPGILIRELANKLETEGAEGIGDGSEIFYRLCSEILLLQEGILRDLKNLKVRKKSTAMELFERMLTAKILIDTHPEKEWSMAELSRSVALSEFHFYRTFKQVYKVSPYQYLLQQRICRASAMLKNNLYSVDEIAHRSGFIDIYSFSKAFKKHTGFAPSYYRKQL
jgi:AraC family transcriptional regulator